MAVTLALLSALAYGVSDFIGGLVAKRAGGWPTAVVGQSSSTVCVLVLALLVGGDPTGTDLAFGAGAGVAVGVGTGFLYRGLATGRMGVVAPVSAIGTALVPLVVGIAQGDRPATIAWWGVAAALPAIWLISSEDPDLATARPDPAADRSALRDGAIAGLGFGGLFALLGQVPDDAGLWPLTVTQACSVLTVVAVATLLRQAWMPRDRGARWALLMGPLGAGATAAFLLASQQGLLSLTSVIASLYPASTVVLAMLLLREPVGRTQAGGLALAALAVSLVALG